MAQIHEHVYSKAVPRMNLTGNLYKVYVDFKLALTNLHIFYSLKPVMPAKAQYCKENLQKGRKTSIPDLPVSILLS